MQEHGYLQDGFYTIYPSGLWVVCSISITTFPLLYSTRCSQVSAKSVNYIFTQISHFNCIIAYTNRGFLYTFIRLTLSLCNLEKYKNSTIFIKNEYPKNPVNIWTVLFHWEYFSCWMSFLTEKVFIKCNIWLLSLSSGCKLQWSDCENCKYFYFTLKSAFRDKKCLFYTFESFLNCDFLKNYLMLIYFY